MQVHPGITTLASCVVIALMLGIYLSIGSITSFIRRQRRRFQRGSTLNGSDTNDIEMTQTINQQPQATDQQINKDNISLQINRPSTLHNTSSSNDEALPHYDKAGTMTDICNSTENGRSRSDTNINAANKSQIITSATLICAQFYANTKSIMSKTSKCDLITDDANLSRDVGIPLISAC